MIVLHPHNNDFLACFQGAFTFRGAMIDMPLLLQAQNIVDLVEVVKNKQQGK